MKCYKCNKDLNQGHEKTYPVPKDFSPHVLHFCDKCLSEWEGSDCEKNYDQQRLEAFKKELAKPNPDGEDKDWMTEEIKAIKTKWNIKDETPQQGPGGQKPTGKGKGGLIVVLIIVSVILAAIIIYWLWSRNKSKKEDDDELF